MKHTKLYLVLLAGAVIASTTGYMLLGKSTERGSAAASLITEPVERGNIEKNVLATGILEPYTMVSVGAQTSGRVTSLKVALGDHVEKGALIAEIDSASQQNALATATAKIDSISAQIEQAEASLTESRLSYERQKKLYHAQATSKSELEAAEAAYKTQTAAVKALKAQLAEATVTKDDAELDLSYTKITAPISGTVLAIVTKEGQTINSNQTTPTIVKIGQTDKMAIKAEISEADVINVKPGMNVNFTILGNPARQYKAVLRTVAPAPASIEDSDTLTPSTNSNAIYYNGVFDADNADGTLRTFMTAQVTIVLQNASNVLTIPSSALGAKNPDGTYAVKVLVNNQVETRSVTIGLNDGNHAEVKDGLSEGLNVVTVDATGKSAQSDFKGPPRVGGL